MNSSSPHQGNQDVWVFKRHVGNCCPLLQGVEAKHHNEVWSNLCLHRAPEAFRKAEWDQCPAAEVVSEPLKASAGSRQGSTHQEAVLGLSLLCVSLEKYKLFSLRTTHQFVTHISSLYRKTKRNLIKAIKETFNRIKRHLSSIIWPGTFCLIFFLFIGLSFQVSTIHKKSFSHSSTLIFHWTCFSALGNLHFLALVWNPFQVVWNYLSLKMDWNLCRKIWICQRLCQLCPSCLNCHQAQKILSPKDSLLDIYRLLKWRTNPSALVLSENSPGRQYFICAQTKEEDGWE